MKTFIRYKNKRYAVTVYNVPFIAIDRVGRTDTFDVFHVQGDGADELIELFEKSHIRLMDFLADAGVDLLLNV